MKLLFVCGTWKVNGNGKASRLAKKMYENIKNNCDVTLYNGGNYNFLEDVIESAKNFDSCIWMPNIIDNSLPKIRDVKSVNPKIMLVTSKRNDNNKYNFSELINHALGTKSNLCIEFSKVADKEFNMCIFDPLGNSWYNGTDISECISILVQRIEFLSKITRQGTKNVPNLNNIEIPNEEEFFELIKESAETFHKLINPAKNVTRFLGNSSFRCQRGFPSFKKDDIIYVSKRNVDKRFIDKTAFVPSYLTNDDNVMYYGENKPSVDTPVQLRLYKTLPKINYMIHSHCYVQDGIFTSNMIPCGGLEEVEEVLTTILNHGKCFTDNFYVINLYGHGCIIMSSNIEKIRTVKYIGRSVPEIMY